MTDAPGRNKTYVGIDRELFHSFRATTTILCHGPQGVAPGCIITGLSGRTFRKRFSDVRQAVVQNSGTDHASSEANEPAFFQFPNLEMRQQLGIVEFAIRAIIRYRPLQAGDNAPKRGPARIIQAP